MSNNFVRIACLIVQIALIHLIVINAWIIFIGVEHYKNASILFVKQDNILISHISK